MVPGLLQTAEYARVIIQGVASTVSEAELDNLVASGWLAKRCSAAPAPRSFAVVDEGALRGPFVILEFAGEPALAFIENHGTAMFLEEETDLAAYRLALGTILQAAFAPAATAGLITQIATELT